MFPTNFNHSIDIQEPVVVTPSPSPLDFKNKVIIITGATSGVGAATAMQFAKWGGLLTIVGRNTECIRELADKVTDVHDHSPLMIHADMTNEGDLHHIVDKTMATYGRIDVLVNNVTVMNTGSIETTTINEYDHIMDINVRTVFQLTSLTVPHLIETKGCIVNVSSVNGMRYSPGLLAFNISQAALDQFTRCIALELASKGVRCNSVNPGAIVKKIHQDDGINDEVHYQILEHTNYKGEFEDDGMVDEVAGVITFLASNMARFINGTNLPLDDGRRTIYG